MCTTFNARSPRPSYPLTCALAVAASAGGVAEGAQATSAPGSYLRLEDARVADVVYRIAMFGKTYCTPSYPATGLLLHHLGEYSSEHRSQAAAAFGLDRGPGILAVVEGSPSAFNGFRAGDVVLSANGSPFSSATDIASETDDKRRRKLIEESEARLEEQLRLGPVRIDILRNQQKLSFTLTARQGCEVRGRLARSSQANAFADGRYAIMTTKMLGFIQNEDELAVVMAHEIAHNLLRHPGRLDDAKVPHGILRNFGKNAARVRATEEDADRLGIKLLWAAGYNVNAAIPFWRRLYAKYDPIPIPKLLRTHPSLGARERIITEVIQELGAEPAGAR